MNVIRVPLLILSFLLAGLCYAGTDYNPENIYGDDVTVTVPQKPYDLTFIDEMTEHHKEGVMMAEMALKKGYHAELRKLALKMLKAQKEEIMKMQKWRKLYFPHAKAFDSHAVGMRMEKLESMSGNTFDLAFLDSMISHHPGAIFLGYEAQGRAVHHNIKSLGKIIAASQLKELNLMRHWRNVWLAH